MQSQLVCNGCRSTLLYPRAATNVCCPLCSTITSAPPPPPDMQSQLVCNGCRSTLLYPRAATNVCCPLCSTITSAPPPPPGNFQDLYLLQLTPLMI
ncbi:hypothetical protein BT93_L0020 [Corymbia citriodora subsp. variegata]|uniref:Zinc finger LSD1-type domain-containing protein n=1 Tax=Corymbia citriodora subsp. variegata TaxID=360336 RepID=A0A8T0CJD9_CORYI|nr:hypothetical protein BT93_L0020 [Corymbia citriodora subsp. variegata]